jgi:hypothetical protein
MGFQLFYIRMTCKYLYEYLTINIHFNVLHCLGNCNLYLMMAEKSCRRQINTWCSNCCVRFDDTDISINIYNGISIPASASQAFLISNKITLAKSYCSKILTSFLANSASLDLSILFRLRSYNF